MSKHTPGPWGYDYRVSFESYSRVAQESIEDNPHIYGGDEDGSLIADLYICGSAQETKLNAILISVAPDILTGLEDARDELAMIVGHYHPTGRDSEDLSDTKKMIIHLSDLISKAKGETK